MQLRGAKRGGVKRCGVKRCGVERCDVKRCGAKRCGVKRCGVKRCGVKRLVTHVLSESKTSTLPAASCLFIAAIQSEATLTATAGVSAL